MASAAAAAIEAYRSKQGGTGGPASGDRAPDPKAVAGWSLRRGGALGSPEYVLYIRARDAAPPVEGGAAIHVPLTLSEQAHVALRSSTLQSVTRVEPILPGGMGAARGVGGPRHALEAYPAMVRLADGATIYGTNILVYCGVHRKPDEAPVEAVPATDVRGATVYVQPHQALRTPAPRSGSGPGVGRKAAAPETLDAREQFYGTAANPETSVVVPQEWYGRTAAPPAAAHVSPPTLYGGSPGFAIPSYVSGGNSSSAW